MTSLSPPGLESRGHDGMMAVLTNTIEALNFVNGLVSSDLVKEFFLRFAVS